MNDRIFVVKLSERPRKIIGPFELDRVLIELKAGGVSWTDIAWSPDSGSVWRRLFEIDELKLAMSEFPSDEKLTKYKTLCEEALKETEAPKTEKLELTLSPTTQTHDFQIEQKVPMPAAPIYLQVRGSEHGPMTIEEMKNTLNAGKFKDQVYIWYRGLETWFPIQEIPGFSHLKFNTAEPTKTIRKGVSLLGVIHGRDGRMGIRHRFAATAHLISAQGKRSPLGVCADISNTGMQIWLENPENFKKNDEIHVELVPLSLTGLPPLPLKAKVMWYNPAEMRLGIFFLDFKGDGWDRLKNYLSKIESQLATQHMKKF